LTIDRTILVLVDHAKHDEARKSLHGRLAIVRHLFEKAQAQEEPTLNVDAKARQVEP